MKQERIIYSQFIYLRKDSIRNILKYNSGNIKCGKDLNTYKIHKTFKKWKEKVSNLIHCHRTTNQNHSEISL